MGLLSGQVGYNIQVGDFVPIEVIRIADNCVGVYKERRNDL